ncbi:MAG: GNAT family N-acetyltransferase [archaeon]|nr:GNAT family N-acetyltransferase [archaeon]MCR4324043.1 GNAT family N-acetyltransferase [Nanoarchaeota archaeon]
MILETERLILRKARKGDWKDILEACKDLDLTRYLAVVPHPYTKKDAEWFVNDCLKKWRKKEMDKFPFLIELKSEKKVIGVISLDLKKSDGIGTTGSWINKNYWKRGYITEAKIAVNEFAFNEQKMRKLETSVAKVNEASKATQEAVGYKYEGTRIKGVKTKSTGKIYDLILYGLMKEDWKKQLPKLKKKLKEKIKKLEIEKY